MKTLIVILLFIMTAGIASAQQCGKDGSTFMMIWDTASKTCHQETLTQTDCRLNVINWFADARSSDLSKMSYLEIQDRASYVTACAALHDLSDQDQYLLTEKYGVALHDRMQNFLMRHNLLGKFIDEDNAGIRGEK